MVTICNCRLAMAPNPTVKRCCGEREQIVPLER